MSATEESTKGRGRKLSGAFNRKIKFYDENFVLTEAPVSGEIVLASNMTEAATLLNNDASEIVAAVNIYAKAQAVKTATEAARGQGLDESVVKKFIKPFLSTAPFDSMPPKKAEAAIVEHIKVTPWMLSAIQAAAASAKDEEEEEDEG
jgi:hypothetical protein